MSASPNVPGGLRRGNEQKVTHTLGEALAETDAMLAVAAVRGLDVRMLCGSLNSRVCNDLYAGATGGRRTLAHALRGVLEKGGNVGLFVWNRIDRPGDVDDDIRALLAPAADRPGVLTVRASHTTDKWQSVSHFTVAAAARDANFWLTRMEKPHPPMTPETIIPTKSAPIQSLTLFDTPDARRYGRDLWDAFTALDQTAKELEGRPATAVATR